MRVAGRLTAFAAAGGMVAAVVVLTAGLAPAPHVPLASHGRLAPALSAGHTAASSASPTLRPAIASPAPSAQPVLQAVRAISAPRHIQAAGGALADVGTMQMLWSRNLGTERPMGSITKVMTALVVIQEGHLNQLIKIPKSVLAYVAKYQAESAGLHPGDVLTAQQLLEAMLLPSGCDAAYVLALTYGPGMPAFLAKMNAMARALGMLHTHFTSPDGLPYPTEYSTYSTPSDLLTLGLAAMTLPVFRSIVDQPFVHVFKSKLHHAYWWDNTNGLIGNYQGAIGIKTGYTDAAGHCLLFEAVRHGVTLIGVVLGSPATNPYTASAAAARLLNWGFGLKALSSG